MTPLLWLTLALEVLFAAWVVRLIWRTEQERPTEQIVPATAEEVELVG